jgi:chorismate--pyruvate lyase
MRAHIPRALHGWLLDPSSLTRRMERCCPLDFRVQPLCQCWQRPLPDECRMLAMDLRQLALVREVHLLCGDQPWVFARTVIPRGTLAGKHRRLARLGTRPLGALLFSDRRLQRGQVAIARASPGRLPFGAALGLLEAGQEELWARRSLFLLDAQPLLVSELFLPAITRCP